MTSPSSQTLLELWERGFQQPPAYRALLLLSASFPEHTLGSLAQLSIGERNQHLLRLRQRLFGAYLGGVADCPACGERLELSLDVSELLTDAPPAPSAFNLCTEGYTLHYRLPNSLDLLALPAGDDASARAFMLSRCVLEVTRGGAALEVSTLPEGVLRVLGAHMAEADPQAVTDLALRCPACEHGWGATLDIASFLWAEVEHAAKRVMHEVHCLASAYGWREVDILGMSAWRRQAYLERRA